MKLAVHPLKSALIEVAEEQEAEADDRERQAQADPQRACALRSYAAFQRRLAARARVLAKRAEF